MLCQLEHVNISVVDLDRTVVFLRIAFPQFRVRGGGQGQFAGGTSEWLHLGLDELYVSLNTSSLIVAPREKPDESHESGINHVGFIVEDVEDLQRQYEAAGFVCELVNELPSRQRMYVADADGIIWEFIQYLSADFAVRNDYSI
jgi:catechol 2,3-dioxygenase-like lactoylglutathione lyase family enzyme